MLLNIRSMKKIIGVFVMMLLASAVFAQEGVNLVQNGSFEEMDKKPKRLGKIDAATGWISPTGVRADVFVDGKFEEIGVPMNVYGKESAKEGENYAGITVYSFGQKIPRSYATVKLNSPMKKGMKYCVEYYVSLAECSKYAINSVSAKFSKKSYGTDTKLPIYDEPSISPFSDDAITARYNWTKVCGIYKADGGERWLTMGNFMSDENTKGSSVRMKKDKDWDFKVDEIAASYYYIDDISVRLLDEEKGDKCECDYGQEIETYSTTVYERSVVLNDEMSVNEMIEAYQLFFAFGKDKLSTEGKDALEFITGIMKENADIVLQINGHNNVQEDLVGKKNDYYADMDIKRIGAVMKYFIDAGIDESRLMSNPKGAEYPNGDINSMDDEDLRMAKNRRITFKVR